MKKAIDRAMKELRLAFYEKMEADANEQEARARKMKAHHRFVLAQDAIRNLKEDGHAQIETGYPTASITKLVVQQ